MLNYKSVNDSLQDVSSVKSLFDAQSINDENDQLMFKFEDLIEQVYSLYNSTEDSFYLTDYTLILELLDKIIYSFQNFLNFATDLCFFRFFIYLLTIYQVNANDDIDLIKEKALQCSSYLVSLDHFIFNEHSEELLYSTFKYIPKSSLALITSINAIKYVQYHNIIQSSGIVNQIIAQIESNEFESIYFVFLSKYSKYLKEYVNSELLAKFQEIAINHSKQSYGFYFLSKLIKNYDLNSKEICEVIQFHLNFENDEFSMSLFRILNYYAMNDKNDFFQKENFFEIFFENFKLCELKMQIKWLDFIYLIAPTFSNELLPFLYHFIEISENSNYAMISKICDILVICFQELDSEKVESQFINLKTFLIFERILSSDMFSDYFKVIEVLRHLKSVNQSFYFQTLYQTSIIQILENLTQTDDDYIQKIIQASICYLTKEEEEDDEDF